MTTKIEWTDETWNPVTGCKKVSLGCAHCYAEREWPRLAGNPRSVYHGRTFNDVACHPERLDQPLRWTKPRLVFVNSMSDLFHDDVPDSFIDQVFAVMALADTHTFQVLTKRPDRLLHYMTAKGLRVRWARAALAIGHKRARGIAEGIRGGWRGPLLNVWLGVSAENQATADERIPLLLQTPAAVRFVSIEPMIGPVDLSAIETVTERPVRVTTTFDALSMCDDDPLDDVLYEGACLDWAIVGCESGPKRRRMELSWARSILEQGRFARVPVFVKQVELGGKVIKDPSCWPADLRVREYPR